MTVIENISPKVIVLGPFDIGDVIPITFEYIDLDNVKVKVEDTDLVYNVDYEVYSQVVTLKKAIDSGTTVTVYRDTPIDQQAVFPQNNKFDSAKINDALDKLCMQNQEQQEKLNRAILAHINVENFNGELPIPEPNQVLQWNETADQLINYDLRGIVDDIKDDADEALSNSEQAVATANAINDKATEALQKASSAKATAEGIEAKADTALAQSATATSIANGAKATAEAINGKATSALTTANSANSTAQEAESKATSAKATAEGIDAKASNALEAATRAEATVADKQDKLTAGTGISIENNIISNTQTSAEWGNIEGEITTQTDLMEIITTQAGYHPPILSCMWSDHLLNDIQWLRADTFSWQSGDVYTTVYDKLVEEYATGSSVTESGITFKRTTNGYKIAVASQESAILSKYNTDGIAWYYILDTTNKRFKLPRMKHKYWKNANTLGVKGNGMTLGLTNGTVNVGLGYSGGSGNPFFMQHSSAYGQPVGTSTPTATGNQGNSFGVTTDATKSGIVADVSTANEETGFYLYFYVGEYSQSATEQTAGLNAEMFNSKVDVASLVEVPILKTAYVNGTSGYRIWSDGYCEQWGAITNALPATVTLPKTYKDTNYNIMQNTKDGLSNSGANQFYHSCNVVSANSFTIEIYGVDGHSPSLYWRTCGYLAEGEY